MVELVYSNYLTYKIVKSLDYCGDIGSLALTEMAIFGQKLAFNHPRRGKIEATMALNPGVKPMFQYHIKGQPYPF